MRKRHSLTAVALLSAAAFPGFAQAKEVRLDRDTVIPVAFQDDLRIGDVRRGDTFTTRVEDRSELPNGTKIHGKVERVESRRGDRPAYLELRFTQIETPDGRRTSVDGTPVSLNDRYTRRDSNGRITANRDRINNDHQYVLGGILGGALLGQIIGKKPFEGAFIGAIAGIVMSQDGNNRSSSNGYFVKRGEKMGVLLDRDVRVVTDERDGRWDNPWDNRDDRWDNGWNQGDRRNWDPRRDRIEFGNRELRFNRDLEPYWDGRTLMVPLNQTANQLYLDIDRSGDRRTVRDGNSRLEIEQDSREYRLNGRRGTLSKAVVRRNGEIYLPLEILAEMKRDKVSVNGTKI